MDKMKMETTNKTLENLQKLKKMFPEVITESKDENGEIVAAVDAKKLEQLLSTKVIEGDESYDFTWVGKKQAIVEAYKPIRKTLRPCREESVDWENTQNLYIEGDNLDVLKLLQESYLNKVKMIYIDPPYNTGKNYIYRNDFFIDTEDYIDISPEYDETGAKLVANPKTYARFHSAWLTNMYSRIKLARTLLSPDGVLVCAIDENEFASLSCIIKEIFGESGYEHSYVSVVHNPRGQQGINFSYVNEYLIFVYPSNGKKYLADFPKDEVDSRNLRDSGTESDRTDARSCFYPFYTKNGKIVSIGDVPPDTYHPISSNITKEDLIEIWPMTDDGDEKKWRYARQSVENILDKLEVKKGRNSLQIIYNKDEGTMRSVWANARYDASEYGTKLLDKLFGGASFTFPKSLYAVYDCIKAATKTDKNALILDFFSGSATTAHAVMQINAEDGGKRKFIMVQLPENLDEAILNASDAKQKNAIKKTISFLDTIHKTHTICAIGEERIRRAGKKIKEENPNAKDLDIGFRVLKLDSSNMKDVYYAPEEYNQKDLVDMANNIKDDRTPEDLLYACMLEWGIELSLPHKKQKIAGFDVHIVNDGALVACFDNRISEEAIKQIAEMKPLRVVFRDSSFASDAARVNVGEIFKLKSPITTIKVI